MNPSPPLGAPSSEQMAGLLFELASQLHVERVRRIALEQVLEKAGLLPPDALNEVATESLVRARAAAALHRAMDGLMRVLTEDADPRAPLRAQTPQD